MISWSMLIVPMKIFHLISIASEKCELLKKEHPRPKKTKKEMCGGGGGGWWNEWMESFPKISGYVMGNIFLN